MGRGDNRKTLKMRRKKAQKKLKARIRNKIKKTGLTQESGKTKKRVTAPGSEATLRRSASTT